MPRWAYSLILRLLAPFALSWVLWRGWRSRTSRADPRQLLALRLDVRTDRPVWLHAASVGEVQALAQLLRALARDVASPPLLLTVGTPTGLARARALYADLLQPPHGGVPRLSAQLAPWDLPDVTARFVRANQPCAAVFVETEIWPNLLAACGQQQVPCILVSARVSARSTRRYRRFMPGLMQQSVRAFASISVQDRVDRERFIALGAEPACVTVGGNLKFDLAVPPDTAAHGAALRAAWAPDRPVWVAGSTHPREEQICLDAHRLLLASPGAARRGRPLLVLAPRRPERFAEVARWLAGQGVQYAQASHGAGVARGIDVVLLDAMGELLGWYAAADVAFVGGSLVPVGGHNLLEPAALGKPVIAGPHCSSSPEPRAMLEAASALTIVTDAAQLAQALEPMLADTQLAQATGARAAAVVAGNRGATQRALAALAALPRA